MLWLWFVALYYLKVAGDFFAAGTIIKKRLGGFGGFTLYLILSGAMSLVLGPLFLAHSSWHGWIYWKLYGADMIFMGMAVGCLLLSTRGGITVGLAAASIYFYGQTLHSAAADVVLLGLLRWFGFAVCAGCVVAMLFIERHARFAAGLLIATLFSSLLFYVSALVGPEWAKLAPLIGRIVAQFIWIEAAISLSERGGNLGPEDAHRHDAAQLVHPRFRRELVERRIGNAL